MSYYDRYETTDLNLGGELSRKQRKKIHALTMKSDFNSADLKVDDNVITLGDWTEYNDLITFLKKVIHIKRDIVTQVTVIDTDSDVDTYWIIDIEGTKLEECFGVVVWGTTEDKLKIKKVLDAHLDTAEDVLDPIVDQIIVALKGGYDNVDGPEPSKESESDKESEPSTDSLTQIEQEAPDDSAKAKTAGEHEAKTASNIVNKV